MLEPKRMSLDEARRTFVGKPYSREITREITREIEATGYIFMIGAGKVTEIREPRHCTRCSYSKLSTK
jgi:hypothetical protein